MPASMQANTIIENFATFTQNTITLYSLQIKIHAYHDNRHLILKRSIPNIYNYYKVDISYIKKRNSHPSKNRQQLPLTRYAELSAADFGSDCSDSTILIANELTNTVMWELPSPNED